MSQAHTAKLLWPPNSGRIHCYPTVPVSCSVCRWLKVCGHSEESRGIVFSETTVAFDSDKMSF